MLDCEVMETQGIRQMPPIVPLVATHLHPKTSMSSSALCLPSKTDHFQSSLTDKCYKAAALSVRALNASTILMAYQAELEANQIPSKRCEKKKRDEVLKLCLPRRAQRASPATPVIHAGCLSHLCISPKLEISKICFPGDSLQVYGSTIRPVIESKGVRKMHRGGSSPTQGGRHSGGHIHRQLASGSPTREEVAHHTDALT